jgi:hypothetical protein
VLGEHDEPERGNREAARALADDDHQLGLRASPKPPRLRRT